MLDESRGYCKYFELSGSRMVSLVLSELEYGVMEEYRFSEAGDSWLEVHFESTCSPKARCNSTATNESTEITRIDIN